MNEKSVSYAAGQIQGAREEQEDRVLSSALGASGSGPVLLLVCDGMGGHAAGALAAETAGTAFRHALEAAHGALRDHLRSALDAANTAVMAAGRASPESEGMGCTLVAAVIEAGALAWISVGDSALLLVRDGKVRRLNADHSMRPVLDELAASGRISRDDAARDPQRNALRSAVTGEALELVDNPGTVLPLRAGDRVLVFSDGVETLSPEQLAVIAAQSEDPAAIVAAALKAVDAAARPRQDNASLAVYCHGTASAKSKSATRWVMPVVLAVIFLGAAVAALFSFSVYHGAAKSVAKSATATGVSTQAPKPKSSRRNP